VTLPSHDVKWKCQGVFVCECSANLQTSLGPALDQQFIQTQACQACSFTEQNSPLLPVLYCRYSSSISIYSQTGTWDKSVLTLSFWETCEWKWSVTVPDCSLHLFCGTCGGYCHCFLSGCQISLALSTRLRAV